MRRCAFRMCWGVAVSLLLSVAGQEAFAKADGVRAGDASDCKFVYSDPVSGVDRVPVNHTVAVYYKAEAPAICKDRVILRKDSSGEDVPLVMVSSREWTGRVGDQQFIWGEVVFKPVGGFSPGTHYSLDYNGDSVSRFRVDQEIDTTRGRVLEVEDLHLRFRNFTQRPVVTEYDLKSGMFEKVIKGFFPSNGATASNSGDDGFFAHCSKEEDDAHTMGELSRLFAGFASYHMEQTRANGANSKMWPLLPYLRKQFPLLFDPVVRYPVHIKKIVYASVSPNGRPVKLSAAVVYPDGGVRRSSRPLLVSIHHPTMPSSSAQTDGDTTDMLLAVLLATRGHVVVMSDLFGHGSSSSEIEPYFVTLAINNEYLDAIDAVRGYFRDSHEDDISDLPIALVGFSQGAHDAVEFSHFLKGRGERVYQVMALSGIYDLHSSIVGAACTVGGIASCPGEYAKAYVGHELEASRLAYKVAEAALVYRGFSGDLLRELFDKNRNFVPLYAGSFYNGEYRRVHNLAAMGSLVGSDEVFRNPDLTIMLYHSPADRVVPARNTSAAIEFLNLPGQMLSSAYMGDCRDDSYLSRFVHGIWVEHKSDNMASHVICLPYFLNDVLKELG